MAKNDENVFLKLEEDTKIEDYISEPRKFIENFCYITTKDAEFKLLKLNKAQSIVMDYVEECLKKKVPIRIRILKSRQLGMSTFISALGFWWATMNENSSYAVVAHKETSTVSIFDKNRIFYENLPSVLRPKTNRFNSEKISYDYVGDGSNGGGLKSRIFFGTAGGQELFRGETILFLHKSEKAFWENIDLLNKSLNAAVPDKPFTCIIDETTANGYNFFKDEWDASVKGENDYKPFFFGWDLDETCQMEVEEGFKLLDNEEEYMMYHDLTMKQMRWRRYKIVNSYNYDLKDIENDDIFDFYQEYPLIPEEAFIASGRSVFNSKVVAKGLEWSKNQKIIKEMEMESFPCKEKLKIIEEPIMKTIEEFDKVVEFDVEKQDYIYKDTDLLIGRKYHYAPYLLAIDTSGSGQDRNVITVWNTYTKKCVALWVKTNISEENLAKISVEISRYYNNAMIAPETNFSHSLVGFIEDLGYDNLYIGESETRIDKKKETLEYGWKTTTITKPIIVSAMKKTLNENYETIPFFDFWEEAEYYLQGKSPSGKDTYNASSGHHDDIVMSAMIGNHLCYSYMVPQNYIISSDKNLFKNMQKHNLSDIMVKKEHNGILICDHSKKTKKLEKGVFKNYA